MAQDDTPLDERVHSEHMQNVWYMGMLENSEFHFPFMSENMLHHYFAGSPFMDWTTKNGLEIKQCQQDPYGWHFSHNRKDFEAQIASRNGTEYMIAEGAQMEFDAEGRPSKGGVYVIRKQDRRKAAPPASKDALETLATYYVIGENVYQAPSVADVLGTRLLSASTALNKCFTTASTLPSWSPTTGHTYPTTTSTTSTTAAAGTATAGAKPVTAPSTAPSSPSRSREPSLSASTDPRSGSSLPTTTTTSSSTNPSSTALTSRLLRDSLAQSLTYADDPFTDENPLLGEPGNLTFTSSTAAAKKRRADAARAKEEALAAAAAAAVAMVKTESKPSTPAASPPASPGKVVKRGKEKRRRKSRHNAQSPPMSPVGGTPGTSPAPGGGA